MNYRNIIKLICLVITLNSSAIFAQENTLAATKGNSSARAQAKIMVVPYTKSDEDIRTIMDENVYIRTAMSIVKQTFDQRGWTTVDFIAQLNANKSNSAFTADRQSDFKTDLLANSGADFYVVIDAQKEEDANGNAIKMILQAYETHTGASFSNQNSSSGKFFSNDNDLLIRKAYEKIEESFMNVLQQKTDEIIEIGRAIKIEFNLAEDATIDFDHELSDGSLLTDAIDEWISNNAYNNRANLEGMTDKKIMFSEVRIPLFNQDNGMPYNPNRFASEIIKFLKSNNISASRNIRGQNIYVTIK